MSNGVDFRKLALGLRDQLTTAQFELAALREELYVAKESRDAEMLEAIRLQARLADAERQNAAMANLLRRSVADRDQPYKQWWNERAELLLACTQPTK